MGVKNLVHGMGCNRKNIREVLEVMEFTVGEGSDIYRGPFYKNRRGEE